MQQGANMFAWIKKTVASMIGFVEKNPNVPAGAYFGTFMVYWAIYALSATHLVDARVHFLSQAQTLLLSIAIAVGAVTAIGVPFAMMCARKLRMAMKTLLVGCGAVAASIVFAFLTSPLMFFISIEVDQWAR